MKAWGVVDYYTGVGYIVYADTRSKARALAMGRPGLDCSEWTDVEVRRVPKLDGLRGRTRVLDWKDDVHMYYDAGWYPFDGAPACDRCGRYEYAEVPESRVTDTDAGLLCVNCDRPRACLKLGDIVRWLGGAICNGRYGVIAVGPQGDLCVLDNEGAPDMDVAGHEHELRVVGNKADNSDLLNIFV